VDLTKNDGTHYVELVFLHPVEFVGYVVHSGASMERNIDPLFFKLSRPGADPTKSTSEHVTWYLCFCILCDMWVT
jgi:hypothetical protein